MVWMGPTNEAEVQLWEQVVVAQREYEVARLKFLAKVGMALTLMCWAAGSAFTLLATWLIAPSALGACLLVYGLFKSEMVQGRR